MNTALNKAAELLQAGVYLEAEAHCQAVLAVDPNNAEAYHLLGLIALRMSDYSKSIGFIKQAIRMAPNQAEYHHNLATTYRVLDRFEEAETRYRRAIDLKPDYAEARFNLAAVRKFTVEDQSDVASIESALTTRTISAANRSFLHFAAGKIYDDLQQYDLAFSHFVKGNQAHEANFDAKKFDSLTKSLKHIFNESLFADRRVAGNKSQTPIFVVGMPRSGTTLTEQILASHPHIFGAGELPDIANIATATEQQKYSDRPFPASVTDLPDAVFTGFGTAYLERLNSFDNDVLRIINKNPENYLYIGLIALLLPNAKIIHCHRNPIDTSLSCYFQKFRFGQDFSYDFSDIGTYYRGYRELMAHWHAVSPIKIFDLSYEDLVANTEAKSRELLAYCEMPWDSACLDFHKTQRPVRTASNQQVRQPIYQSSVERWKGYEKHIEPLTNELSQYLR